SQRARFSDYLRCAKAAFIAACTSAGVRSLRCVANDHLKRPPFQHKLHGHDRAWRSRSRGAVTHHLENLGAGENANVKRGRLFGLVIKPQKLRDLLPLHEILLFLRALSSRPPFSRTRRRRIDKAKRKSVVCCDVDSSLRQSTIMRTQGPSFLAVIRGRQ